MSFGTYGGHEFRVYYVVEQSYGETPSNPTMLGINCEEAEPTVDSGLFIVRALGSRDPQSLRRGLFKPSLKLTHVPSATAPVAFIQHAAVLSSLSVQALWFKGLWTSAENIISLLYKGMRMDKLTVETGLEELVKASVELTGQNVVLGTGKIAGANYADYAEALCFADTYVQRGSGDGSSLAEIARVTDWKFSIANNLKPVHVLRSVNMHLLKYLQPRHRELTGEVGFAFEEPAEINDIINDSEFSLRFVMGSGSALFKGCKWETVSAPTRIEDLVTLRAKFVARDVVIS
ncbi:MAG: phage tail tube protein [Candidatus Bathyarchaeota archaeon]|nr:phage tail tube protein [Candidatus Bathyarchaeota archaeon]